MRPPGHISAGQQAATQTRPGHWNRAGAEPPHLALLSALFRSTASLGRCLLCCLLRCLPCLCGLALLLAGLALPKENASRVQPALCEARPTIDPKLAVLKGCGSVLARLPPSMSSA